MHILYLDDMLTVTDVLMIGFCQLDSGEMSGAWHTNGSEQTCTHDPKFH
jgi:hypothetical protein